jgi:hypothetical protein
MNKRLKYIVLAIVTVQLCVIAGFLIMPSIVRALPGEMRVRLARLPAGERLLEIGVTPLPMVLPAPSGAIAQANQRAMQILTVTPAAPPTAAATSTMSAPHAQAGAEEDAVVTAEVTITPLSTPPPTVTVSPTPIPLPSATRIEGLEIIAQGFNNCGPANLAINLNFYGNPTTQAEAAAFLKPNREDRNVSPWQMVDYVNEQTNLRATIGSGGDLDLLKRLNAAGFPVVIEKGYELVSEGWLGHYLTIFGYDDETQEMVSLDTNLGPWDGSGRYDAYGDIEKYWQQFNRVFFVVYPPQKEQQVLDILGSEMMEETTMWQQAAQEAQAEIDGNPENAFAWFNLGTSFTHLGELTGEAEFYQNGAAAFDQAFILGVPPRILWYQFRPYIAYLKVGRYQDMLDLADTVLETQGGRNVEETYLYKGHALAFLGDGAGTVDAYEKALSLNENFYPAQWALDSTTRRD